MSIDRVGRLHIGSGAICQPIMEILIDDIPDEGLDVSATEKDAWLIALLADVAGPSFEPSDGASLSVAISKFDDNVNLSGTLEYTAHPDCDRCLVQYEESSSVQIHAVLAPLYENRRQEETGEGEEAELVREDLEFAFYEGDRFDLAEIIREQAILARPMKRLCKLTCLGLCQRCGKNLNEGPCGCAEDVGDPRWAKLKGVRLRKG